METVRSNLPVQLTSFVGREKEIEEVKQLLQETRMLTLTGSGGCGKTRLAIQIAEVLIEQYDGGVWLVDLASVRDPSLVVGAFVSALGLAEKKEPDPLQTLIGHLKSETRLIIIDNCEHLIAECARLSDLLLRQCPAVTLMATSREPLGIAGETAWRVPSLSLPEEAEPHEMEALTNSEAVRLFIDRAVKSRPNFKVTDDNAAAVAQICLRLDGIPLAVELAAARTKVLTPQQISDGLTDRFHLLTGGTRSAMPRQRTLQASVDWSYDLLSEQEKTVLKNLSVFAGGFTLDAAEAVCAEGDIQATQVLDLLEHLADKSLVLVEDETAPAARYRLLETIRQYAEDRVVESGGIKDLRNRHMNYFLQQGESWWKAATVETLATADSVPEAKRELDNFRAAARWALDGEYSEIKIRLATVVGWILVNSNHRREAASLLEEALLPTAEENPGLLWPAWIYKGWAHLFGGGPEALESAERALYLAGLANDPRGTSEAITLIGQAALLLGDTERIISVTDKILDEASTGSFQHIFALALKAAQLLFVAELAKSRALFEEAAELSRTAGSIRMQANALIHLGMVATMQGDFDYSERVSHEANKLNDMLDPREWDASFNLGNVALFRGMYREAREHFQHNRAYAEETGMPGAKAGAEGCFVLLALAEGDFAAAAKHAAEFTALAGSFENESMGRFYSITWRDWIRASGDLEHAGPHLRVVREAASPKDEAFTYAFATMLEGKIDRDEHDFERADAHAYEALEMFKGFGARLQLVDALEVVAGLAADQESFEEATRLFAAAESGRTEVGYVRFQADEPRHESDLQRLKEALGDQFKTVWDEGSILSLDEAASYALRRRGQRKRPSAGWSSLTPAELRIADLVAEGLNNPKIAERLFISRNTVESHLKSIFAKLEISSRTQLAGEATRRGLSSQSTS